MKKYNNIAVVLIALLVLADFATKYIMRAYSPDIPFVNYMQNTGVIFGVFQGYNLFFILLSAAVLGFLFYFYKYEREYSLGLDFIIAGALGNLIDRISYGYVIDFIDLRYWPVFNLADVFIVVGALIVIFMYAKEK